MFRFQSPENIVAFFVENLLLKTLILFFVKNGQRPEKRQNTIRKYQKKTSESTRSNKTATKSTIVN